MLHRAAACDRQAGRPTGRASPRGDPASVGEVPASGKKGTVREGLASPCRRRYAAAVRTPRQRWFVASLFALACACSEREVVYEPLWEGDIVQPRFGGTLGDGSGAPIADTAGGGGGIADGSSQDGSAGALDATVGDAGSDAKGPDTTLADVVDAGSPDVADTTAPDTVDVADSAAPDAADTADAADAADVADTADVGPPKPSFPVVWSNVLQLYGCASPACHGASTAWPIFVDMQSSYATLLSNPATGPCAPGKLVVKGQPDASILVQKIDTNLPLCGARMPNDAGVDAEALELVRDWIAAGAPF
ncbi:MAG: hypothetical protein RIT45_689 [Pseudomonadota bacterium]